MCIYSHFGAVISLLSLVYMYVAKCEIWNLKKKDVSRTCKKVSVFISIEIVSESVEKL